MAGVYYALTRTEGWRDYAARLNVMLSGLRRDLERNPFDPKTGRDRSDELRAMVFSLQRALDIPQRAIDAEKDVSERLRRTS